MRVRMLGVMAALVSIGLIVGAAWAGDDGGKGDKKKKRGTGEKVELKDLPSAVTAAAEKKAPKATWTSAEKHETKKQGTVYTLHGKVSNLTAAMAISSSGDVLQFTEGSLKRGKKRPK